MARPRTDSIPRFNIDTHLQSNKKFYKFKRLIECEEWQAWHILSRFFNYVNANCAITAQIKMEDAETIAEFCHLDKVFGVSASSGRNNRTLADGGNQLIEMLQKAGFLNQDLSVHDQEIHQPLASEIKRKRKENQDDTGVPESSSGFNSEEPDSKPNLQPINLQPETYNLKHKTKSINPQFDEIRELWNSLPDPIPKILKLNDSRKKHVAAKLSDPGFNYQNILGKIRASPWLLGRNEKNWVVTFDWVFKYEGNWQKILEGNYDDRNGNGKQLSETFKQQLRDRECTEVPDRL